MLSDADLKESGRFLGRGAFGEVREGTYCGLPVAIKVLHDTRTMDWFRAELEVLRTFHHPNLVSMIAFDDRRMVLEKFDSDASHIRDYKDLITIARDCMRGIYYMHMHGDCMRHGDIKPENILIKRDYRGEIYQAALGDLGLSRSCSLSGYTGTPGYMPRIENEVTRMHDIFALAVSLLNASTTENVHASDMIYRTRADYPLVGTSMDSVDNTMVFAATLKEEIRHPIGVMLLLVSHPGNSEEDKRKAVTHILDIWETLHKKMVDTLKKHMADGETFMNPLKRTDTMSLST